jgi:hypothetical protein
MAVRIVRVIRFPFVVRTDRVLDNQARHKLARLDWHVAYQIVMSFVYCLVGPANSVDPRLSRE